MHRFVFHLLLLLKLLCGIVVCAAIVIGQSFSSVSEPFGNPTVSLLLNRINY